MAIELRESHLRQIIHNNLFKTGWVQMSWYVIQYVY